MHVFALITVQVQFQFFTKLYDVNLKFGHYLIISFCTIHNSRKKKKKKADTNASGFKRPMPPHQK